MPVRFQRSPDINTWWLELLRNGALSLGLNRPFVPDRKVVRHYCGFCVQNHSYELPT